MPHGASFILSKLFSAQYVPSVESIRVLTQSIFMNVVTGGSDIEAIVNKIAIELSAENIVIDDGSSIGNSESALNEKAL